jgi:hypothetical protein
MGCAGELSYQSEFEIKIDNKMEGKDLIKIIQKLSLVYWNDLSKKQSKFDQD